MNKKIPILFLLTIILIGIVIWFVFFNPSAKNNNNKPDKQDLIKIDNPLANQVIENPLIIIGQARGLWFFEAS